MTSKLNHDQTALDQEAKGRNCAAHKLSHVYMFDLSSHIVFHLLRHIRTCDYRCWKSTDVQANSAATGKKILILGF